AYSVKKQSSTPWSTFNREISVTTWGWFFTFANRSFRSGSTATPPQFMPLRLALRIHEGYIVAICLGSS
ncbi:MAG: hypothetical protein O6945_01730, partial [Gammaproteobacteria bacterium]|nr:hypothetical protein [Gammaproteobacteria bacterium]